MSTTSTVPIHRWRAFVVLAVSFFMTIVDLTIVNVALPTIGRELSFSETNLQWVVTAYGLTFGGFLLLGGRAADLLGRRRILMLGLAIFTAASLGAGLATTAAARTPTVRAAPQPTCGALEIAYTSSTSPPVTVAAPNGS